jgi:hypothetical protein
MGFDQQASSGFITLSLNYLTGIEEEQYLLANDYLDKLDVVENYQL